MEVIRHRYLYLRGPVQLSATFWAPDPAREKYTTGTAQVQQISDAPADASFGQPNP
ncbi:hypothetical protein [Streptomyces sp. NPDC047042]|uniref:hypothetical protein n=1 Tax=Streptomyces sp. NPDC047042 TaxID=3154807 RepID=UPI00340AE44F